MTDYGQFRIILDVPAESPGLSFEDYAKAFADVIEGSEPRFSIGVFGGWGAGKTTLMDGIRNRLDLSKCVPVAFSAWRYEKEEHLIIPLLDAIRDALNVWGEDKADVVKTAVAKTASVIGGATESILRGFSLKAGIPKVVEVSFDANKAISAAADLDEEEAKRKTPRSFYFASFESLKDCFSEFHGVSNNTRIVVFIDDLDRCLPEGALEVLESMKLFFDFDGFVFVVGLDQQVVEWCIDRRYASHQQESEDGVGIRGADYIKKIFQVPFALPPIAQERADLLLQAIINNGNLEEDQVVDLEDRVRPHLEHLLAGGNVNLRDVKRFLNSYSLIMKVHQDLDPNVVLALQTIAFTPDWRVIFEALRVHREDLARELRSLIEGGDHAVAEIAPELGSIPVSFERYVQAGAPGSELLGRSDLSRYINLATSATAADLEGGSTYSYVFIDLLRGVAAARRAMSGGGPPVSQDDLADRLRNARDGVHSMEKHVESLRGVRGAETLGNQVRALTQRIDSVHNQVKTAANRGDPNNPPTDEMLQSVESLGEGLSDLSEALRLLKAGTGLS